MWINETSVEIAAGLDRLWSLFADVEGWPSWNAGIERIELRGPFVDGTQFMMQPPGMEPFVSTLAHVRSGHSFSDVTVLGGTTVTVHHSLAALDDHRTRVTYVVEVTGPAESELGPIVTADFGDVLASLRRRAEQSSDQPTAG